MILFVFYDKYKTNWYSFSDGYYVIKYYLQMFSYDFFKNLLFYNYL